MCNARVSEGVLAATAERGEAGPDCGEGRMAVVDDAGEDGQCTAIGGGCIVGSALGEVDSGDVVERRGQFGMVIAKCCRAQLHAAAGECLGGVEVASAV